MRINVFIDGSCEPNPGRGGWAFWCEPDGRTVERSGSESASTNQRMELTAAIKALEHFLEAPPSAGTTLRMVTDSQYVQKGATEWLDGWKSNGWRSARRDPVKNQDLWKRLDASARRLKVEWHWVKGHNGHAGNERADALARAAGNGDASLVGRHNSSVVG